MGVSKERFDQHQIQRMKKWRKKTKRGMEMEMEMMSKWWRMKMMKMMMKKKKKKVSWSSLGDEFARLNWPRS